MHLINAWYSYDVVSHDSYEIHISFRHVLNTFAVVFLLLHNICKMYVCEIFSNFHKKKTIKSNETGSDTEDIP